MEDASGEREQERWLEKKDAMNRARWSVGVREIVPGEIWPPPFTGINPDQNWIDDGDECMTIFFFSSNKIINTQKKNIQNRKITHFGFQLDTLAN